MPHARSVRFPVRSPVSVSPAFCSPVPMVVLWPSPHYWISAVTTLPAKYAGAKKLYLPARLGLAPSAPSRCLYGLTSLPLPTAVPRCGISGAASPGPLVISSVLLLSLLALVYQMVGGFPSPTCPRSSSSVTLSPLRITPEVLYP